MQRLSVLYWQQVPGFLAGTATQGHQGTPELTHRGVWGCPRLARALWELLEGAPSPSLGGPEWG